MLRDLTLSNKMTIFGIFIVVLFIISILGKVYSINKLQNGFDIFSQKAVSGKIATLEVQANLNYISRCTRDIMLGNAYEKNIEKIEKSIASIDKNFKVLENTIKGTPNEAKKLKAVRLAHKSTLAFVDDGYKKMKSLASKDRTTEVLQDMYQQYRTDATPLANESRKYFSEIKKTKDKGLVERTNLFKEDINILKTEIIIESIVILVMIMGYMLYITKGILKSINNLRSGMVDFFKYLNKESDSSSKIDIINNDELGEMSKLINENIEKTKNTIEKDAIFIDDVARFVQELKSGNMLAKIEKDSDTDSLIELKKLLIELQQYLEHTIANDINILLDILDKFSHYDYRPRFENAYGRVAIAVNTLGDSITEMLVENKANGLTLDYSSDVLLKNVDTLNTNSNEAAAALEETAAILQEITSNITHNTENVVKMSSYANELTLSASDGQQLAHETTVSMDEINAQVSAINEAISVIDQIAFQTNILSLNAAVEAATAGEAGKGFAVVAGEVRNLAARSAEAASEIKNLVENATVKANNGKSIADKMIDGYNKLNDNVAKTMELIKDVETASKEQQSGIEQINDAVTNLDKQTQQNAMIATQTHDVAVETDEIAKLVVSNADAKEFDGKDSVKRKVFNTHNTSNTQTTKKPTTQEQVKELKPNDTKDEWESF